MCAHTLSNMWMLSLALHVCGAQMDNWWPCCGHHTCVAIRALWSGQHAPCAWKVEAWWCGCGRPSTQSCAVIMCRSGLVELLVQQLAVGTCTYSDCQTASVLDSILNYITGFPPKHSRTQTLWASHLTLLVMHKVCTGLCMFMIVWTNITE